MIAIEKNIPLAPTARRGKGHAPSKYPLRLMEIGDSFAVPIAQDEAPALIRNRINSAIRALSRRDSEKQFCIRTVGDSIRVWRVA